MQWRDKFEVPAKILDLVSNRRLVNTSLKFCIKGNTT
jgi:hypothetical protein